MFCAAAGLHSDAEVLINHARQVAQRHKITNGNEIGCEQLVRSICDLKQVTHSTEDLGHSEYLFSTQVGTKLEGFNYTKATPLADIFRGSRPV